MPTLLLDEPIRAFLETPRIAYLSTIDLNGFPHTVPVWFAVDGDDLITSATAGRARVKHIQANPNGSIVMGGNLEETEGYLFKGTIRIEDDPSHTLLTQIIRRYMGDAGVEPFLARVGQDERLIFRLTPTKILKVR